MALLLAWELAFRAGVFPQSQAVGPVKIARTMIELCADPVFLTHILTSVCRVIIGVLLGTTAGMLCGVLFANTSVFRRMLSPTLAFLAGIPVVVWMPFWIMFFGTGEVFRIGLVGIASFFLTYSVAFIATLRTSKVYFELLQLYEKTKSFSILHVYLPAAAAAIFTSTRLAIAFGWVVLFFAEYAVSQSGSEGLGWFVANARAVGRIEDEFAGLMLLGIIAYLMDRAIAKLQRKTLRWADSLEDTLDSVAKPT